jgi:plastocyanin
LGTALLFPHWKPNPCNAFTGRGYTVPRHPGRTTGADTDQGGFWMGTFRIGLFVAVALAAVLAWALPAGAHSGAARASSVKVTAGKPSEFHFVLSKKTVPKGAVTFTVTNNGTLSHDFKIGGKRTKLLTPGQSAKLTISFAKAGKFQYLCTVSGHAAAGMKGTLTVK